MRRTKEIKRVVEALGFHPDYWVHIPTPMLPALTKQVQLLDAYREAWGLLSLKQKQCVYQALEDKRSNLIMEDMRTI